MYCSLWHCKVSDRTEQQYRLKKRFITESQISPTFKHLGDNEEPVNDGC